MYKSSQILQGFSNNQQEMLYLSDAIRGEYFNKPLSKEQKAELVQVVGLKDSQSHKVGWPTLKKALSENGCTILTHRMGTKNYDVIVPPDGVED